LALLDDRYIPPAIVVNYKFFTLPVVITVPKKWEFDTSFFPECVLETFAEFLPEPFAFDKVVVVIAESDEYVHDIAAELVKL
jgi:hypothetical protein